MSGQEETLVPSVAVKAQTFPPAEAPGDPRRFHAVALSPCGCLQGSGWALSIHGARVQLWRCWEGNFGDCCELCLVCQPLLRKARCWSPRGPLLLHMPLHCRLASGLQPAT